MMLATTLAGPLGLILAALGLGKRLRSRHFLGFSSWVAMDLIWTVFISWRGMISGQWSDIFLMMTNLIALTSVFDSALWLREHPHVHAHRYYVWWALFWAALIGLAISQNLALSWLAVEFSTLTSGALIIETGEPHALEAAWKYIVIASVGLLLGLIGVVFLYASLRTPGSGWNTLNYSYLALHSHAIAPVVGQLVSIFLVVGFGTKAGLVPFHTWLPDAHSEAPSPVSGLLSGVLLGLSLFTLVRVVPYLPKPPHAFLTGDHLLTLFGCLSVAVGSLALLVQQDIKRLLAYSSVEQVGLMALAAALNTPASLHAALWQFALHAVIKSSLFYGAGHLSVKYGTKALKQIRGLQAQHRFAATAWAVGILALAGVPPFGLAYSEWLILGQLWIHHSYFIIVITASALTLTFASLTYHLLHTLWEPPEPSAGTHRELSFWEETAL